MAARSAPSARHAHPPWWLNDDPLLPFRAGTLIAERRNQIFVSPMSLWEMAIKSQLGKLRVDADEVRTTVLHSGFQPVPCSLDHAAAVARLSRHHRAPCDRTLVLQAALEPLTLLTHDDSLAPYGGQALLV